MSLALLFSPQGSQAVGMGRELVELSPAARRVFDAADRELGWSVTDVCFAGPAERLDDTRQTQPALLATSIAALRALEERTDLAPAFAAGHSVGEYAALVAAEVLDLGAALRLVARRGELMADVDLDGGMVAVLGLERGMVEEVVAAVASPTDLVVANDNAPGQVVISGRRTALEAAESAMKAAGARRVVPLPVSGPFHSPLMASVAEELARLFEEEEWRDAAVPVVSNVTAEPLTDARRIRALLAEQVRSPVEWVRSVTRMSDAGVDRYVECGAGNALAGMVRRIVPGAVTAAVSDTASLENALVMLDAAEVPA